MESSCYVALRRMTRSRWRCRRRGRRSKRRRRAGAVVDIGSFAARGGRGDRHQGDTFRITKWRARAAIKYRSLPIRTYVRARIRACVYSVCVPWSAEQSSMLLRYVRDRSACDNSLCQGDSKILLRLLHPDYACKDIRSHWFFSSAENPSLRNKNMILMIYWESRSDTLDNSCMISCNNRLLIILRLAKFNAKRSYNPEIHFQLDI